MRLRLCLIVLLFGSVLLSGPRVGSTQERGVTVFENVRVLTMTDTGTVEGVTVIVEGDRISSVTRSAVEPPSGSRVIDGSGMTLLPGLADMHVHVPEFGPLFLANGITTVRQPWGQTFSLTGDALAKAGVIAGPHIYASGPIMDGENPTVPGSLVVTNPDAARGAIAAQAAMGFRAIKLYHGLDAQTFSAAVSAAHELDMQVWAHTPSALTYDDMLALGVDSIEHLWWVQYSLMDSPPNPALPVLAQAVSGWNRVEDRNMPDLAARTAEAGLWNVPTLTTQTQLYEYAANAEEFFKRPEMEYLGPGLIQFWQARQGQMAAAAEVMRAGRPGRERWVKALFDAGAGLLVGTDTPNPFVVPGYSFHEEMDNLSRAGIPNDALLRMATSEAARFLDEEGEFGVVAVGARADLILVEGDPLTDLEVLRRPSYVMVNGHLRDRADLQRELDALASQ